MTSLQDLTILRETTVYQTIRCGQELVFVWVLCGHRTRWSGAAISELADRANDNTGRLAGAVRQALVEARQSLDAVATDAELRDFVERWVGPMVLRQDGSIAQKESAAGVAADAKGLIAGARNSINSRPESGLVLAFSWGSEGVADAG